MILQLQKLSQEAATNSSCKVFDNNAAFIFERRTLSDCIAPECIEANSHVITNLSTEAINTEWNNFLRKSSKASAGFTIKN